MASPIPTMTEAQRTRARQLEESRQFLDALLSGQMPTGFAPTIRDWSRVLNLIEDAASLYGWEAVTPAIERWVAPAIYGNLPVNLRNQALELLAKRAITMNAYDPVLHQFLMGGGAGTVTDLATRASLLSTLAPRMFTQPWFQEAYRNFVQQLAPTGSAEMLPMPIIQALAQPYFTLQQAMGPQAYSAAGLPTLQWPTSDTNMPRHAAELVRNINEILAQLQGYQVGPYGLVRETPAERRARVIAGAPDMLQYVEPPGGAFAGIPSNLMGGIPGMELQPLSGIPLPAAVQTEEQNGQQTGQQIGQQTGAGLQTGQQERQSALRQFLQTIADAGRMAWQFLTGTVPAPSGLNVEQVRQAFARPSDLVRELQILQADPTLTPELRTALQQLLFWAESLRRSGDRWPQQ